MRAQVGGSLGTSNSPPHRDLSIRTSISQSATEYIEEKGIQKSVEEVLNATIKARPEDPYSFMVRRATSGERSTRMGR